MVVLLAVTLLGNRCLFSLHQGFCYRRTVLGEDQRKDDQKGVAERREEYLTEIQNFCPGTNMRVWKHFLFPSFSFSLPWVAAFISRSTATWNGYQKAAICVRKLASSHGWRICVFQLATDTLHNPGCVISGRKDARLWENRLLRVLVS